MCLSDATPARAQETQKPVGQAEPRDGPELEHRNEVAGVIAGTWDDGEGEGFLTLGVEYERRFTPRLGVVAEVERLFDADRWIAAAPFTFRPVPALKLFAGPGFERSSEEIPHEPDETETRFLFRIGAAYAWEFAERYSFGPTFSLDYIREEDQWNYALVFGVTLGVAF
jgi:hypothetical protein